MKARITIGSIFAKFKILLKKKDRNAYCWFCGASVGDESERTGKIVSAIFDCSKCRMNYCDQCSYHRAQEPSVQRCLRCERVIKKVT